MSHHLVEEVQYMRRFLVPLFLLALVLVACGRGGPIQWGNLRVSIERPATNPDHWTAVLALDNPTTKTQVVQYNQNYKYTVYVTQGGKEIYRGPTDAQTASELLSIAPKTAKEHRVTWTYKDQTGAPVPPGTYQVKVELHATTPAVKGPVTAGPINVMVK